MNDSKNPRIEELVNFSINLNKEILSAKRIISFFHENPDLDSVGSNYALYYYCQNINPNIQYEIYTTDNPNSVLCELVKEYSDKAFTVMDPSELEYREGDLVLMVDYSGIFRATRQPNYQLPEFVKIASIDHHRVEPKHSLFYLNFENQSASSIVYELFNVNNIEISEKAFKFLIMGIVGDSNHFRYKDMKFIQTLDCVKELVSRYGISAYYDLVSSLEKNLPPEEFFLKKIFLNNLVVNEQFAYTTITNKDKLDNNVPLDYSPVNGPASFIKNIGETKFAFSIHQDRIDTNQFNLSFRSCAGSGFLVRPIAEKLGGGGHNESAGAQIKCDNVQEAIKLVLVTIDELAKL